MNITTHETQARLIPRRVTLHSSAAIKTGVGVCYAFDKVTTDTDETINDPFGGRDDGVELPDSSNSHRFAGVLSQDYPAPANGATSQIVMIYEPGSTCQVAVGAGVAGTGLQTLGDVLSFHQQAAGQGRFALAGSPGVGSCQLLQTLAIKAAAGEARCYAGVLDGPAGGATVTSATLTLTDTGQFTEALAEVGDNVVILGGITGTTSAWAGLGDHTIASRTNDNAIVLDSDPLASTDGAEVAYYCFTGNPTCLAYLYPHGHQSGGTEYFVMNDGGAGLIVTLSPVGRSHLSVSDQAAGAGEARLPTYGGQISNCMKSWEIHGADGSTAALLGRVTAADFNNGAGAVASVTIQADGNWGEILIQGKGYALLAAYGTVS